MKNILLILFFGISFLGCNEPQTNNDNIETKELELPKEQEHAIDSLRKFYARGHDGIR